MILGGDEGAGRPATIEAERVSRLGLLASLAFAHFVHLYRKFDENQPRDERGRWSETGAGRGRSEDARGDPDTTGSVTPIRNEAFTGNLEIDSMTSKLAQKLADVIDTVGEGSGALYGIRVHSAFAEALRTSGLAWLDTETTWFGGLSTFEYGLEGSIRTDVIMRAHDDAGPVIAVWDVKTGNATLGPSRVEDIRRQVGVGPSVPVIELNVRRGVMIKTIDQEQYDAIV